MITGISFDSLRISFKDSIPVISGIFDLYTNEGCTEKEDFTTLNAKAAYRFGTRDKGLNIFVKGENLTAARYSINEGFPMPKAIFM